MSKTISVQFSRVHSEDYEATIDYLNSLGMTFTNGLEDDSFFQIEVSNEPAILDDLRKAGIFKLRGGWSIMRMTSLGINLYISCPLGDSYAFIPSHQIISIHTVDQDFLSEIQQQSKKIK